MIIPTPSYGNIFIFIVSILSSISLLIVERFFGIGWDYHPDAIRYINDSISTANILLDTNPRYIFNNFYYFIVAGFNQNYSLLILLNILIFAFTNSLLAHFIFQQLSERKFDKKVIIFLVFLIIFSPYRVHLSIHLLKDTLIIFAVTAIFISLARIRVARYVRNLIPILFLVMLRSISVIYLFPSFKFYLKLFLTLGSLIIFLIFSTQIIDLLTLQNAVSLNFRSYDAIPTFSEYGTLGVFIRALIWPILVTSGLFLMLSPSFPFLIMGIGAFMQVVFTLVAFKKFPINIWIFGVFAVIALGVPGFTSYIRYCYPLLAVTPLIFIFFNKDTKNSI